MRSSSVPRPISYVGWCARSVVWCVVVSALAGCSSDDAPAITPPMTIPGDGSGTEQPGGSAPVPTSAAGEESSGANSVTIDVAVGRLELSEQLEVAVAPSDLDEIDPFTRFSSCSGLRASVGTFAVTAVDDTAAVRSVSVVTVDRVTGPGIYDADIRLETAAGETVSAAGTVTLAEGLRSGTFEAFEATGENVSGTFMCDGPTGTPVPLVDVGEADDDDASLTVEVVALLRRGDQERIVGLALDTSEVVAAEAACPGVTGRDGSTLVSVVGGPEVGAITEFELAPEQSPSMQMEVAGASYVVDDVEIDLDDRGLAGTFSGVTADGIAIDGAFRCA